MQPQSWQRNVFIRARAMYVAFTGL